VTPTSTKTTPPAPTKPTRRILGLGLATIVVAAIALGLIYFFGGAEPPEVDLDATVNAVAQSTILESTTQSTSPDSAPDTTLASDSGLIPSDVTGRWIVDTDTGTFSIEEATASYAGFRVDEELAQIGASTAVGRSPVVSGAVTIDQTTITQAEIEVDLTAIVTDESRRNRAIRQALNTAQYPTATFVLTEPIDFGEVPTEGATVTATATGDMTINGVTRTIEIPLEAQVAGESILIVGSTEVVFADFQVDTPSAPMVLSVADQGTIEVQLWLKRA
jgi:polyisoprenoid-binding protein YceI